MRDVWCANSIGVARSASVAAPIRYPAPPSRVKLDSGVNSAEAAESLTIM